MNPHMIAKIKSTTNVNRIIIISLIILPVIYRITQCTGGYVLGIKGDWLSQHTVFPEYFRQLFYDTKEIFPDFAKEIGGGQNIYNFTYYGLFNPLYLPSYLLPFVPMTAYIMVLSVVLMILDGILCYVWLKPQFGLGTSCICALMTAFAAPILCHSCKHIMFVDYIPFLLLALIGYDRYTKKEKYGFLTLTASLFFILIISYYYAVSCFFVVGLYVISGYKKNEITSIKKLAKNLWFDFKPFLLAGLLAMFYIAPLFLAMINRSSGRMSEYQEGFASLFIPFAPASRYLYYEMGIGATAIFLLVVCMGIFYKPCRAKWLAGAFLFVSIIPICSYMLNGGLYVRDKALIPFLPILCWLYGDFINRLKDKAISFRICVTGFLTWGVLIVTLYLHPGENGVRSMMILDIILTTSALAIYLWKQKIIFPFTVIVMIFMVSHLQWTTIRSEQLTNAKIAENPNIRACVEDVEMTEDYRMEVDGFYNTNRIFKTGQKVSSYYSSLYNGNYYDFRYGFGLNQAAQLILMQSPTLNPIFSKLMGIRYYISDKACPGYKKLSTHGKYSLYENKNVAPIMYVTDQIVDEETYNKSDWKERQLILQDNAVVQKKDAKSNHTDVKVEERKILFDKITDSSECHVENKAVYVKTKKKIKRTIYVDRKIKKGQCVFVSFEMKDSEDYAKRTRAGRTPVFYISVNGQTNCFAQRHGGILGNGNNFFRYNILADKDTDKINISFHDGSYKLENMKVYVANFVNNGYLYKSPVNLKADVDENEWKGEVAAGTDGYLITSLPYDDNFQIFVDGKRVQNEKVNIGFLGAKIGPGKHEIYVYFKAPGKILGICISIITMLLIAASIFFNRIQKHY